MPVRKAMFPDESDATQIPCMKIDYNNYYVTEILMNIEILVQLQAYDT